MNYTFKVGDWVRFANGNTPYTIDEFTDNGTFILAFGDARAYELPIRDLSALVPVTVVEANDLLKGML